MTDVTGLDNTKGIIANLEKKCENNNLLILKITDVHNLRMRQ